MGANSVLAQSTEAPPREPGTDALGRRTGAPRAGEGTGRQAEGEDDQMFLTPPGYPNAIDIDRDKKRGFWVHEQRHDNKPEAAWLLDWNGKLLHTVMTNCKDTSGVCYGDGFIWSGANGASEIDHPTPPINGMFQTDMNGKTDQPSPDSIRPQERQWRRNARHDVATRPRQDLDRQQSAQSPAPRGSQNLGGRLHVPDDARPGPRATATRHRL